MLCAQALFILGSALCGSAESMTWLIAARSEFETVSYAYHEALISIQAIQGAGGASLQAISQIVISDLVPLQERPLYLGLSGMYSRTTECHFVYY